jgi:hypothetical protein
MKKKVMVTVATTLRKRAVTNFLTSALLVMYLAGLMIFHAVGNFGYNPIWDHVYWLWNISRDLLFWVLILGLTKGFELVIILVITYTFIRLCLEVITIILKTGPNVWFAVDILFLVLLTIMVLLSIIQRLRK